MTIRDKHMKKAQPSLLEDQDLAETLEKDLIVQYGPLLSGEKLSRALGYPSMMAFRKALSRDLVPVPVFTLKNRKGKYALVKDVAIWLATERLSVSSDKI